jgi:nucleotide-binding universal stress UspA family protein
MIRTILVPLDGSAFGEHALAPALGIARRVGAMLRFAVVYEPAVPLPPVTPTPVLLDPMPTVPPPDPRLDEELRAQRKSYLASVPERVAGDGGVHVTTALLEGAVSDALVTHAEEIGADLVVMTTHGRGGLSRLWLGSVAEDVIRGVTRPVLLVRPGDAPSQSMAGPVTPRGFARVLVALDGSSLAETVLEPTMEAVGTQAEWVLMRVVEPITAISLASFGGVAGIAPDRLEQHLGNVGHYLEAVAASLRASGLTVRTHAVVHTQPARAILEYSREIAADLVALATHGRSGLRRLVMGSVADKVLRGGESATLLYRPPAE